MGSEQEKTEEVKATAEEKVAEVKEEVVASTPSAQLPDLSGFFEKLDALPDKIVNAVREATKPAEPPKVETVKEAPKTADTVKDVKVQKPHEGDSKTHWFYRPIGGK